MTGQKSGQLDNHIMLLDQYINYDIGQIRKDYEEVEKHNIGVAHREPGKFGNIFHAPVVNNYSRSVIDYFTKKYNLQEFCQGRDPMFITFKKDSTLHVHKDSISPCWVAIVVSGDQPICFYESKPTNFDDNNSKFIGRIVYNVALVDGYKWHGVDVNSSDTDRVLLRQYFDCDFYEAKKRIGGS